MPCKNLNHSHVWATEGAIVIERCEKICFFCNKEFKHAWFLRRHVTNVHCKEYTKLTVLEGWTGSPNGNRRPNSPEKRGRHSRTPSANGKASGGGKRTEENTPPNGTENVAVAESVLFGGTMAQEDTFLLDPNLDLSSLFPFQMPVEFRTASSFVTPQTVRTEGGEIQAVMPSMEHHGAAGAFADGLNNIVADVVGNGGMTAEEIVYVLETFTDTFKIGLAMPVNGF